MHLSCFSYFRVSHSCFHSPNILILSCFHSPNIPIRSSSRTTLSSQLSPSSRSCRRKRTPWLSCGFSSSGFETRRFERTKDTKE